MVSADGNMPVRGSGKGKAKADAPGKKSAKRARKPRQEAATADPLPETPALEAQELRQELRQEPREEPGDAPVAPAESFVIETAALDVAPAETQPVETAAVEPVTKDAAWIASAAPMLVEEVLPAPSAAGPVGYQAISNAYGDYTRKSIEQTGSFFEQLAGVRSFSRAFQLQTEFAQRAYETFVAELRRIRELHSELTRQRLKRLEGLVTGKATRCR